MINVRIEIVYLKKPRVYLVERHKGQSRLPWVNKSRFWDQSKDSEGFIV